MDINTSQKKQPVLSGDKKSLGASLSRKDSHHSNHSSHKVNPKNYESLDANQEAKAQAPKRKRERRSKETTFQRNYVCGCGKTYLSYAALYTHAKTKHDGVFPEGTATLHKKKGGRPKKDEWTNMRFNSEYQRTYDFNKDFQSFLDKIPDAKNDGEKKNKNLIEYFPCEIFAKEDSYREVLIALEQIRQEILAYHGQDFLPQIDVIIFEINNAKRLTCNQVFALFLIYAFRFVSKAFYRDLVFLLMGYRRMLNEFGWEKYKEIAEVPSEMDLSQEFCANVNGDVIPDFANKFMLEYFFECIHGRNILGNPEKLKYFGLDPLKLLWAILVIKYFCQWLFIHKLTKARIDIKKD